jgi:hypothetical protein
MDTERFYDIAEKILGVISIIFIVFAVVMIFITEVPT